MRAEGLPIRSVPSDLRAQVARAIEPLYGPMQDAAIGLTVCWSKALPSRLDVDGDKLAWVVKSLVEHALRYARRGCATRPGGRLGINVGVSDEEAPRFCCIEVWGDEVWPEEVAAALRGESSLVNETTLALVREIVQAHSGRIELRTSEDELAHYKSYTRIKILIPLWHAKLVEAGRPAA